MSNTERAEFESMINEAWDLYDAAVNVNDIETAALYKEEALHLLSKLPKQTIQLRIFTAAHH